jgi:hypothetical protein
MGSSLGSAAQLRYALAPDASVTRTALEAPDLLTADVREFFRDLAW